MALSFTDAVLLSTNYDKSFASENLLKTYQLEYEDGTVEDRIDLGDWRITQIIRQINTVNTLKYNGVRKFTTLCYLYYDNTTCYRLVLIYNGYMHPYEIPSGAILLFPEAGELLNAVYQVSQLKRTARSVIF